jgi:alpha-amylase
MRQVRRTVGRQRAPNHPAAALNYVIHQPSGDTVPTTREPGGDRAFVPAVSPEVWVSSGDPTIYAAPPG